MPYECAIAEERDIPELVSAMLKCFQDPLLEFLPFLMNTNVEELTDYIIKAWKDSGDEMVWIKVYDSEDPEKKVAGGSQWFFIQRSPFEPRPGQKLPYKHILDSVSEWWPEGSMEREFSTRLYREFHKGRVEALDGKPHCYLAAAFTCREHRRKGVAELFLNWGLKRADELGLGCYLEASEMGAPVYKKYGFIAGRKPTYKPQMPEWYTEEQKKEWKKMEEKYLTASCLEMWHPVNGEYIEGQTALPWDGLV